MSFTNEFSRQQFIPIERSKVFSFFSKAENLEVLTPPELNFRIINKSTPEIQKNTIINYKLKIHGIPIKWRTLIKEWNPEHSFVDYQLKGPYWKWHHTHTFEVVNGGTLVTDHIIFEVPGWYLGKFFLPFVKKDIQMIFDYRQNKIIELCTLGRIQ